MKTLFRRIKTFLKSLYFHIQAGLPKSSQNLINKRYDICIKCDKFENNQCLVCGCNLSRKKVFLNKLAWADQKCPLEKW
jgi:hypothetical protein